MSGSAAAAISLGGSNSAHLKERDSVSWSEQHISLKVTNQVVTTLLC